MDAVIKSYIDELKGPIAGDQHSLRTKALSFDKRRNLVEAAINKLYPQQDEVGEVGPYRWVWIREQYDRYAIYEYDGQCYRVSYSITEPDEVLLGVPVKVKIAYVPE